MLTSCNWFLFIYSHWYFHTMVICVCSTAILWLTLFYWLFCFSSVCLRPVSNGKSLLMLSLASHRLALEMKMCSKLAIIGYLFILRIGRRQVALWRGSSAPKKHKLSLVVISKLSSSINWDRLLPSES